MATMAVIHVFKICIKCLHIQSNFVQYIFIKQVSFHTQHFTARLTDISPINPQHIHFSYTFHHILTLIMDMKNMTHTTDNGTMHLCIKDNSD